MFKDNIIVDLNGPKNIKPFIEAMTIEEKNEFDTLEVLDVEVEQAEYIQTIAQGWAAPLNRFMNEEELLEVIHMK